jgi:hypothetical protein
MAIKRIPKVGEDIYLPGALYLSHGVDDYVGGLAKVAKVHKETYGTFITTEEIPGHSINWEYLEGEQAALKKEFGKKRAYPDPDDSYESNRWD